MSDLFDAAKSRAAKEAGMRQVDENATPGWSAEMLALVQSVARRKRFFTADDVFEAMDSHGIVATTHDKRAFGPVMMRAARARYCQKSSLPAINSRRASLHASPRQVWESLIFDGGST